MAYDAEDDVYVEADSHPDATTPEGVLVVEVNGPPFFADAAPFRAGLLELLAASGDVGRHRRGERLRNGGGSSRRRYPASTVEA